MPVSAQIGCVFGNDNEVADARFDRLFAKGAYVWFPGLVRLDRLDDLGAEGHPSNAHTTTAAVMTPNTTTRTMSSALLSWSRNGLNPIRET